MMENILVNQDMNNLVKNICKNCTKTYERYDSIGEATNKEFCSELCYFEYYKKQDLTEDRRKQVFSEIMKMSVNQKTFTLSIHCISCNLGWTANLNEIKKLVISNMKCPICFGQVEGIIESK